MVVWILWDRVPQKIVVLGYSCHYGSTWWKKTLKLTPSHRLHFPFLLFSGVFIHKKCFVGKYVQPKRHESNSPTWFQMKQKTPKRHDSKHMSHRMPFFSQSFVTLKTPHLCWSWNHQKHGPYSKQTKHHADTSGGVLLDRWDPGSTCQS